MKKVYMQPLMTANEIETASLICLSLQGTADGSDALVKERGSRTEVEAEDPEEILSIESEPEYGSIW